MVISSSSFSMSDSAAGTVTVVEFEAVGRSMLLIRQVYIRFPIRKERKCLVQYLLGSIVGSVLY